MKATTKEQISNLVSYFKDSAYAQTDEITELAEEIIEKDDTLSDVEDSILEEIEVSLFDYEYIECEDQGSYRRHIWHKTKVN
jgi:hypothetical protein